MKPKKFVHDLFVAIILLIMCFIVGSGFLYLQDFTNQCINQAFYVSNNVVCGILLVISKIVLSIILGMLVIFGVVELSNLPSKDEK